MARARKGTPAGSRAERGPRREKPQQIADELRQLIVSGPLSEGDSLGCEPELVEHFGVSRTSLREALRILEAEGPISGVRGMRGGIVVQTPDTRMTARTAALEREHMTAAGRVLLGQRATNVVDLMDHH